MKFRHVKIVSYVLFAIITGSCESVKRVGENEHLLMKNSIVVDDKKDNSERLSNLLYQRPNRTLLFKNFPLRLHIYNTARPNIDSIVQSNIDKKPNKRARLEKFLSKKKG